MNNEEITKIIVIQYDDAIKARFNGLTEGITVAMEAIGKNSDDIVKLKLILKNLNNEYELLRIKFEKKEEEIKKLKEKIYQQEKLFQKEKEEIFTVLQEIRIQLNKGEIKDG